jgi:hypothetical protein
MAHTHTYSNCGWGTQHITSVHTVSITCGTPIACPLGHAACKVSGVTSGNSSQVDTSTIIASAVTDSVENTIDHTHTVIIAVSSGSISNAILHGTGSPNCGEGKIWFNNAYDFPASVSIVSVATSAPIVLENGCHYHTFDTTAFQYTATHNIITLKPCSEGHADCNATIGAAQYFLRSPSTVERNTSTVCIELLPWVETNNPTSIRSRTAILHGTNHGCTTVYFEYKYWSISGALMGTYTTPPQTGITSTYSATITMPYGWARCCFRAVGVEGATTYYGEWICFTWAEIPKDMVPDSDHEVMINKMMNHIHPIDDEHYTEGVTTGNDVDHGDRCCMNLGWYHTHGAWTGKVYMFAYIGNWPPHSLSDHV